LIIVLSLIAPVQVFALFDQSRESRRPEFIANELVVQLSADASTDIRGALVQGFRARNARRGAADLDAICARHGTRRIRRAIRQLDDGTGRVTRTSGQLIEKSRRDYPRRASRAKPERVSLTSARSSLERFIIFEFSEGYDRAALEAIATEFAANELVVTAELNYLAKISAIPFPSASYVPNDPYVSPDGVNWAEGAFGQSFPDLFGLRNTRAVEAWQAADTNADGTFGAGETAPGEGIVVAVVDSGLDINHWDIAANVFINPGEIAGNGIDDDLNGFVDDINGWNFDLNSNDVSDLSGHGTHVAGTIAAVADNYLGIVGVAPFAKIMPIRAFNEYGVGTCTAVANSLTYAVANGADVISNSWGSPSCSVIQDAFDAAEASGVLSIAASGNNGLGAAQFPSSLETVVAVAALDSEKAPATFSNIGEGVEIAAPGVSVLSLSANWGSNVIWRENPSFRVNRNFMVISGTSMACPHVSGVAALMMSADPSATAENIRVRLATGADTAALATFDAMNLGAGHVDALASLDSPIEPYLRVTALATTDFDSGQMGEILFTVTNFGSAAANVSLDATILDQSGSSVIGALARGESTQSGPISFFVFPSPLGTTITGTVDLTNEVTGLSTQSLIHVYAMLEELPTTTPIGGVPIFVDTTLPLKYVATDFSGDGLVDLAAGRTLHFMALYKGQMDGSFEFSGGATPHTTPLFLDVDGDADLDLIAYFDDESHLFKNDGTGTFTDATAGSGLGVGYGFREGAIIDLEGDGDLDVLGFTLTAVGFKQFVRVFENDGTGHFTDRYSQSGIPDLVTGHIKGSDLQQVAVFDYDLDGDHDVIRVSYSNKELLRLLENDGSGVFSDVTSTVFPDVPLDCGGHCWDQPYSTAAPASFALGDYDNDLDIDIFIPGMVNLGAIPPEDRDAVVLLNNNGDGTFSNVTATAGNFNDYYFFAGNWGTTFADIDNDGDLDLYFGLENTLALPVDGRTRVDVNMLFENLGDGTFYRMDDSKVAEPLSQLRAMMTALADFEGNGMIDFFAGGSIPFGQRGGLLRNLVTEPSWMEFRLTGSSSNTMAIGAQVKLADAGSSKLRIVHQGPLDPGLVHFGLGGSAATSDTIDGTVVEWPSGISQAIINVRGNRVRRIYEAVANACAPGDDDDADGVCNSYDNCRYEENGPYDAANQLDVDLDGFGNACDADVNNDGMTSAVDFAPFLPSYESSIGDPQYDQEVDFNGDGSVDDIDYDIFLYYFSGQITPVSGLACADPTGATAPCTAG